MPGGQGKSFIILGSILRESMAWQDYGDKHVEFCVETIDYRVIVAEYNANFETSEAR